MLSGMSSSHSSDRTFARHRTKVGAGLLLVVLLTGRFLGVGNGGGGDPALAQVVHGAGYSATVLGWTSWYGNYGLGDLGWGWCIDHGIAAPDADFHYQPTFVADASADTRAAMAWAAASNVYADRNGAAATMLALHDLMGAQYPFGRMNVDGLTTSHFAGFGGNEWSILERSRQIKAEALAHRHLRGPAILRLEATPVEAGAQGVLTATLTDANGAPIEGMNVELAATGAWLPSGMERTGADGSVAVPFTAAVGRNDFVATAQLFDLEVHAFAPTLAPAQRIVRPGFVRVPAAVGFETAPPPTTVPPTTTPPTTAPPTTQPPTTTAPTTTTPPSP